VWVALAVFTVDLVRTGRRARTSTKVTVTA
jgi:hypothetical protein